MLPNTSAQVAAFVFLTSVPGLRQLPPGHTPVSCLHLTEDYIGIDDFVDLQHA